MRKMLFVLSVLLGINNAMAQETTNPFDFRNFDYQAYQIKLQKFLETLTPQERIIFVMSQNKNSSNSSKECELDSGIERKIDDIYEKVKKIDNNLYFGSYYKIKCK
ncbi:MAG: hypothetical protein IJZ30_03140 [Alphaproteobacteria bacterium]|nr:hypothetical protein [Alphaproteobacteria bacterium]